MRRIKQVLAALSISVFVTNHALADDMTSVLNDTAFLSITTLQLQMTESANRRIPANLRASAKCIAVFPSVVKAGLIIAAKQGNGLVSCRHAETGEWGAPAVYSLSAASIGIQAGIQSASYILLFLDDQSAQALTNNEVSLGSDFGIAAGPVGAAANVSQSDKVLSYVRTTGLFAGVDLEGAVLSFSEEANKTAYAKAIDADTVLYGDTDIPLLFEQFHQALNRFAPTQ